MSFDRPGDAGTHGEFVDLRGCQDGSMTPWGLESDFCSIWDGFAEPMLRAFVPFWTNIDILICSCLFPCGLFPDLVV